MQHTKKSLLIVAFVLICVVVFAITSFSLLSESHGSLSRVQPQRYVVDTGSGQVVPNGGYDYHD